jgi:carotenoid cleavage dioxygenase
MMFFNYPEKPPYMNYGVIDKHNRLVHYVPIDLPGARWPHDLGITKNYTILHDLPFHFDNELLAKGQRKMVFYRDRPARFGILPRFGDSASVRWFEATPCHILHLANCYEDGDEVVMDGCIMPNPHKPNVGQSSAEGKQAAYDKIRAHLDKHNNPTLMYRWRFNLKTGQTHEEQIDDEITEFPMVANDYVGRPYRYSFNVLYEKGEWLFRGLKRYDLQTRQTQSLEYGKGRFGSEPQIGRRIGAQREDDGYVLTFVNNMAENQSECWVIPAEDITRGPLARIILPHRISAGTHACWVEHDRIHGETRDPRYIPS